MALLGLCETRIPLQEATRWLAAELKRAGINQPNGRIIDARTLTRWRSEIGGKALKGSDQAHAQFVRGTVQKFQEQMPQARSDNAALTQQDAKSVAAAFIKLLKYSNF